MIEEKEKIEYNNNIIDSSSIIRRASSTQVANTKADIFIPEEGFKSEYHLQFLWDGESDNIFYIKNSYSALHLTRGDNNSVCFCDVSKKEVIEYIKDSKAVYILNSTVYNGTGVVKWVTPSYCTHYEHETTDETEGYYRERLGFIKAIRAYTSGGILVKTESKNYIINSGTLESLATTPNSDIKPIFSFDLLLNFVKASTITATYKLEAGVLVKEQESINEIKDKLVTLNIDRVKILEQEALKIWKDEKNIDIVIDGKLDTVELMVRYPELEISNNDGDSTTIEDLYISLTFTPSMCSVSNLKGTRTTFYPEDVTKFYRDCCDDSGCSGCDNADEDDEHSTDINELQMYSHSHLPGAQWLSLETFCLGSTHIAELMTRYKAYNEELPIGYLLRVIKNYLEHESTEGGPWILINDKGAYSGEHFAYVDTYPIKLKNDLEKFIKYGFVIPVKVENDAVVVDEYKFIQQTNTMLNTIPELRESLNKSSFGKISGAEVIPQSYGDNKWSNIDEDAVDYIKNNQGYAPRFKGNKLELNLVEREAIETVGTVTYGMFPLVTKTIIENLNNFITYEQKFSSAAAEQF